MGQEKEPFISSQQRPGVALHPDTPISELRVRDLQTLLQRFNIPKTWPEFKDSYGKPEKSEYKEMKNEAKYEGKNEKYEIDIVKSPKENKENKENEGGETFNRAAMDQLIRTISGLSEQVTQLTQEVEKLKQRPGGG